VSKPQFFTFMLIMGLVGLGITSLVGWVGSGRVIKTGPASVRNLAACRP